MNSVTGERIDHSRPASTHSAASALGSTAELALPSIATDRHHFQLLPSGAACIAALERLIRSAQRTLCFEMYIYKPDATGAQIRAALLDACRRGVRLRILLDDFGSNELPRDFFLELEMLGAQLRWFNPSRALRAAFRNHRKTCIADHGHAIVGGFNIADEYNGDGVQRGWRDLGLLIEGPLADELEVSFDRMFIAARADTRAVVTFARGLAHSELDLKRPALLTVGPGFQGAQLRKVLYRDFWSAHRIAIVAAYFAPTWRLRRALRKAARRGIVRLILPGKSDVPAMRLAAQHLYESILRHRIELYEYEPQVLHAKLIVVDEVVYVGSCNFDVRSLQLNFDLLVRVPNATLASQAREVIKRDMELSRAITLPEWHSSLTWSGRIVRFIAYWLATRFDPFLARRNWRALR